MWLSIALVGTIVVHLLLHWQWLVNVLRRFFGRLARHARVNSLLNILLLNLDAWLFSRVKRRTAVKTVQF